MIKQLFILVFLPVLMIGGTITITTTAQQDARMAPAFKEILMLNRDPTAAEIKSVLMNYIRQAVLSYEIRQNAASFTPQPLFTSTPTPTGTP